MIGLAPSTKPQPQQSCAPHLCGYLRFAPNAPEQNPTEDVWLKGKPHLRKQFALNKPLAQVKRGFSTFLHALRFTSTKLSWYWPMEQRI
jgi:transposase